MTAICGPDGNPQDDKKSLPQSMGSPQNPRKQLSRPGHGPWVGTWEALRAEGTGTSTLQRGCVHGHVASSQGQGRHRGRATRAPKCASTSPPGTAGSPDWKVSDSRGAPATAQRPPEPGSRP